MHALTTTARSIAATPGKRLVGPAFCILFLLQGLVFIPCVGLQNDELLFTGPLYAPDTTVQGSIRILGHRIPTMLMVYVGALKAWIYRPILDLWPPSPWSIRLPVLFLGAVTIWLFFVLARNACGTGTGVIAAALLTTDATFVLTTCFDWGPVVLQHFLLVSGCLLLWRFHRTGALPCLGGGFFVFGAALWDKALFSWSLVGLLVAAAVVFPRALSSKLTLRNIAIAVAGFLIGAAPVLAYNAAEPLKTFRTTAQFSVTGVADKALMLRGALEGSALIGPSLSGYIVRDHSTPCPGRPANAFERASVELDTAAGPRAGLLPAAGILALILLPWLWRTPARAPMLFALIFSAAVWSQMAFTKGAGTGQHHAVLLWPFPQLFVASALAETAKRLGHRGLIAIVLVVVLVCGSNVLILNRHIAQLIGCGATTIWTDAIDPLAAYLRANPPGFPGASSGRVYLMDWGIFYPLLALSQGRLDLRFGWHSLDGGLDRADREVVVRMLADKDAVFVGHTAGNALVLGVSARLDELAQPLGYRKKVLTTISDRHGRPIFEVFRFLEGPSSNP